MKTIKKISVLIMSLTIVWLVGCSKEDITTNTQNVKVLEISPVDNSSGIRLDESIVLKFAKPVDKQIVENNFHLISERDMADSSCPYGQNMMHGNMNMAMMDSLKMNHLDSIHYTPGKFIWNSELTNCVFTPDSMFQPNMQYMTHFGKDMFNMMQLRMGDMMGGGMMGNGNNGMTGMGSGQMSGHMMQHFTTMDTTGLGSGHGEHH